ncbi:MAG: hypothetical protein WCP21_21965 [Armatimonadota bacterium]
MMTDRSAGWRFGCVEWGCAVAVLFVAVILLLPLILAHDTGPRQPSCLTHVRLLSLGMLMYAQDWDERLPHVQSWAPALKPYLRASQSPGEIALYRCPQDMRFSHDRGDQVPTVASYAMVPRWSLQPLGPQDHLETMLLLYEIGPAGPAYRHNRGIQVGLGDGHAKWVARGELPLRRILTGEYRPTTKGGRAR